MAIRMQRLALRILCELSYVEAKMPLQSVRKQPIGGSLFQGGHGGSDSPEFRFEKLGRIKLCICKLRNGSDVDENTHKRAEAPLEMLRRRNYLLLSALSIESAACLPAPIASITVAAPVTASPPA